MKPILFALILAAAAPVQAQSCSINTYGGMYSGTCSQGGIRYNINGSEYGPSRVRGYLPDGGSFNGTVNGSGTFRGYVNGRPVTCSRYLGCQ